MSEGLGMSGNTRGRWSEALGEWVEDPVQHPAQVGRNAKRQDAEERLGPKDEHAVAEGDAPKIPLLCPKENSNE